MLKEETGYEMRKKRKIKQQFCILCWELRQATFLLASNIKMAGMLLNFVHLQVHKNIKQKSLRGFTTVLLYLLCQNGLLLVYKLKTIFISYLFLSRYLLETLTKILRFITTLIHQLSLVTSVFDPWHGITTYQWGWKSTAVRMVR